MSKLMSQTKVGEMQTDLLRVFSAFRKAERMLVASNFGKC